MNKKDLSERDICTKFITPAIQAAVWQQHQFREEVKLTKGRVMVRGQIATRIASPNATGGPKRADSHIPDAQIPSVIEALLNIGDTLINPSDDHGMFDFGNVSRVSRPAYHLLKRAKADQRAGILESAIITGKAIAVQLRLLQALEKEIVTKEDTGEITLLKFDEVESLKTVWLDQLRRLSRNANFLEHTELPRLLAAWERWADEAEVRTWCEQTTVQDERLLKFLSRFLQHTKSQSMGDWAVHLQPRLNPAWLESYIDTAACAKRLRDLQRNHQVPSDADETVSQYLREFDMLQEGKNPDGIGAFDDQE